MSEQKSVLIVDDQEEWRDLLVELLEDDYDVKAAATLEEGWKIVLDYDPPFHVVITDLRLVDREGNEDGLRLAELLKRLGEVTQVIVITGYPSLGSVKRALGELRIYDYIEKVPSNGTSFDSEEFKAIVQRASDRAEENRQEGFTSPQLNALVIGGSEGWRQNLVRLLRDSFYLADVLENAHDLVKQVEGFGKAYSLVIFSENIPQEQPDFFDALHRCLPDAKKILFTEQNVDEVVQLMQEHTILNVFAIRETGVDPMSFRETLRRIAAPEATRYAVATVRDSENLEEPLTQDTPLLLNHPYQLQLTLQNARQPGATPVWLLPMADQRGRVQFHVFIYAPEVRLDPDAEAWWEISPSGQIHPLVTNITPQVEGELKMSIDLEQDNGWSWRLNKTLHVVSEPTD